MGMLDKAPEELTVKENLIISTAVLVAFVGVPMLAVGGVYWLEAREERRRREAWENRTKK